MKIKLLFPIRHEKTTGQSNFYYVSLDTSYYRHLSIFGNVFKISLLGFGLRIEDKA